MQSSATIDRVALGDALERAQEQAVAELEDVRFVDAGDAFAALADRGVEGEAADQLGRRLADHAQALDHAGDHFVLQSAVEAFGVFADDDQVDVFVARGHAGDRTGRAVVGVELEFLPHLDVDAAEAGAAGRSGRAFERGRGVADHVERGGRERGADLVERGLAGDDGHPFDGDAGRVDDALSGGGDFGPDAVAGNESNTIRHGGLLLQQIRVRQTAR